MISLKQKEQNHANAKKNYWPQPSPIHPFVPEQHVMERLRCNTCGAYFTAQMPEEVLADGDKTRSMVILLVQSWA
jgi:hypothetical protein